MIYQNDKNYSSKFQTRFKWIKEQIPTFCWVCWLCNLFILKKYLHIFLSEMWNNFWEVIQITWNPESSWTEGNIPELATFLLFNLDVCQSPSQDDKIHNLANIKTYGVWLFLVCLPVPLSSSYYYIKIKRLNSPSPFHHFNFSKTFTLLQISSSFWRDYSWFYLTQHL